MSTMKKLNFLFAFLLLIILFSCNEDDVRFCTLEFRFIHVNILEADSSDADIDSFFVVKTATGDTILDATTTPYNDFFEEGITIFTDNELSLTTTTGSTFNLTAYKNTNLVVNENYVIQHDECHIDLLSGDIEIFLEE
jgi:hypothetical protein